MVIVFATIWDLKWCRRTDRCLVRGRVRWLVAISIHDWLSSNTLQRMTGVDALKTKPRPFNSFKRFITPITSRSAVDRAIYSASVVDKAIRDCILEAHIIGQPA